MIWAMIYDSTVLQLNSATATALTSRVMETAMVAAPPSSSVVVEPAVVVLGAWLTVVGPGVTVGPSVVVGGSGTIESTYSSTKFTVRRPSELCCHAKFACTVARADSAVWGVMLSPKSVNRSLSCGEKLLECWNSLQCISLALGLTMCNSS